MKRIAALVVVWMLVGCSHSIVMKPAVYSVKKLAVVSLYTNRDIYDVKSSKTSKDLLAGLSKVVMGDEGLGSERVQVATAALQSFTQELGDLGTWSVVPAAKVLDHPGYKALVEKDAGVLARLGSMNVVTPPGMVYIPFGSVVERSGVYHLDGKDPFADSKEKMAALCRTLDVDGVAVIDVDVAYESGWLSGMSGTGLFGGVRGRATPSVSAAMVIITRDGGVAVKTKEIQRGGGDRFTSESTPLLLKGRVDLTGDSGHEAVLAINTAVQKSAAGLKSSILDELR